MHTLPNLDHSAILTLLANSRQRAVSFKHDEGVYWAKRALPAKVTAWHRLQQAVAAVVPVGLLKSTQPRDPAEALSREAERLRHVQGLGFHAPDVVRVTPEYLLMTDAGDVLTSVLDVTTHKPEREALIARAAALLSELHEKGGWHGRAALRDFVVKDGKLGFLDCEEEAERLGDWAQARDLWLFCHSIARIDPEGELIAKALDAYAFAPVKERVRRFNALFAPLGKVFTPFGPRLGKDLKHALITISALQRYFQK